MKQNSCQYISQMSSEIYWAVRVIRHCVFVCFYLCVLCVHNEAFLQLSHPYAIKTVANETYHLSLILKTMCMYMLYMDW